MSIKNQIQNIIKTSLDKLAIDYTKIEVERPNNLENGDYSTNIAFNLAKSLHTSPIEIANKIKDNLNTDIFSKIEVVNPGFINFYLKKDYLTNIINDIITKNNDYGKNNIGNNKKINIEFVSANPTGILHIGHARGATYGDNLARILKFIGYDVTKEYYINDAGNQMNNLAISIKERYKEICGLPCNLPEDGYHGKEIVDIAKKIYNIYGKEKLDSPNEFFKKEGLDILLDQIKKDLDTYRVNYDVFTSEQSLYDAGEVDTTLNNLKNSDNCYINDNALWLKTTNYNDDKDRVLIKSDGNYTYLLPDVAYHMNKYLRGYDKMIDVFGSDHHGYINRLKASLEILGQDSSKLDIRILQMVRLIKDGEELKLSKRTGKTFTLIDLIEEVGVNACRYFFSSKSIDTMMDFNINLALEQSNNNPVYYIEYANARITSILNNYQNKVNIKEKYDTLDTDSTYIILNKLAEFEEIVTNAGLKQTPHLVANYVYELAGLFHSYYAKEKIITEDNIYTSERILLLHAIKIVINNALNLIGIIPREEM